MVFSGSCVALITPFDQKNNIDYFSLKHLIEFQIANGTKAILILGTTGEASTITSEERTKIIKFCACVISKRVPLIIGTGSNSTNIAINLTKEAQELGADAALIVTPYYNKCNQQGLLLHYKKIAAATNIPIILYNVPSRTGVNILPETVLKLSKIKNIVGIKESSGNISQIMQLFEILPKTFAVYSGDDLLNQTIISMGGAGAISVTANCYPELVQLVCDYSANGDLFNARRLSFYLQKINKALFLDVNPTCIKFYMSLIGFKVGKPRLPLTEPTTEIKQKLKEIKKLYEN